MAADETGMTRLLVVEDDPQTAVMAERCLVREGYLAEVVGSAEEAMAWIDMLWPDLVVLDMRLGGPGGLPLFRWLRHRSHVPVVMISPLADGHDRAWGLNLGADDFVPAPLSALELVARVGAVLRRAGRDRTSESARLVPAGPLVLDQGTRRVRVLGNWVALTALEFGLLDFFVRHPNAAFHRRDLLKRVWGYSVGDASTVTVHIRRLREKIEPDPARPTLIVTVWGAGYRYDPSGWQGRTVEL